MKIEHSLHDRVSSANLCRKRALECLRKAKTSAVDNQRGEWEAEARHYEELAARYDDGEEIVTTKRPIEPNRDIDINYLNSEVPA